MEKIHTINYMSQFGKELSFTNVRCILERTTAKINISTTEQNFSKRGDDQV